MTTFDLRALVDTVLADTELCDPRDLAAEVRRRTPRSMVGAAYQLALVDYVRLIAHAHTRSNPVLVGNGNRPSRKVAAVADWWQRAMSDRVCGVDGEFKSMGECTVEDLLAAADRRRKLAAENIAAAERYERLAKLLADHGAETVADLPMDLFVDAVGDDD